MVVVAALALPASSAAKHPKSQAARDADIVRFFKHHPRLRHTPAGAQALWLVLQRSRDRVRSLQAAKAVREAWPAHHDLWMCIHNGEGNWDDRDSGRNGHYGGLQMHPGWGYGTSWYASDDSQLVQEQSAERGYVASGYSSGWLNGQWGQTIGPCWGFV